LTSPIDVVSLKFQSLYRRDNHFPKLNLFWRKKNNNRTNFLEFFTSICHKMKVFV